MRTGDDFEWNDAAIAQLRQLWAEGLPTRQIGERLGVSKNAVVGKAHRLNLPARPSPIRRDTDPTTTPRRRRTKRVRGATLPVLASTISPSQGAAQPSAPPARCVAAPQPIIRALKGRVVPCCWPMSEPGNGYIRFCDSPSEHGKPYCPQHCVKAYVRVHRRNAAA